MMPILRSQNGSALANTSDINGTKEGHWFSENTYDVPGGKVDAVQETSIHSGQGWHTQATKQTSVMKQEFAGADIQPNAGNTICLLFSLSLPLPTVINYSDPKVQWSC